MNEIYSNVNVNNNKQTELQVKDDINLGVENKSQPVKKNKKMQYYKFLFYSIKAEIKIYEFITMISWTNHIEILVFLAGLLLFFELDEKSGFAIVNVLHLARGICGHIMLCAIPKSHEIMNKIELSSEEMEEESFNNIIRKQFKKHLFDKLKANQTYITVFFGLTIINLFIDVIDFIVALSDIGGTNSGYRIRGYSRIIISVVWLSKT